MKKIQICIITLLLLFAVCLFSFNMKSQIKDKGILSSVNLTTIEALASGEVYGDVKHCDVGYICLVLAEATVWCGTCHFDYVYKEGDGYCMLD